MNVRAKYLLFNILAEQSILNLEATARGKVVE